MRDRTAFTTMITKRYLLDTISFEFSAVETGLTNIYLPIVGAKVKVDDEGASQGDGKGRGGMDMEDDDLGMDTLFNKGLHTVEDLNNEKHYGGGTVHNFGILALSEAVRGGRSLKKRPAIRDTPRPNVIAERGPSCQHLAWLMLMSTSVLTTGCFTSSNFMILVPPLLIVTVTLGEFGSPG